MSLPRGTLGYRFDLERPAWLEEHGHDPRLMLKAAETLPPFNPHNNPLDILSIKNQGSVGACQGFGTSSAGQSCYWRATGRKIVFSGMGTYIWSQEKDGLRGRDVGSTLSGGQWVATQKGFCLDSEWKFTGRYSSKEPSPKPNYDFRLKSSKRITDLGIGKEWLYGGLPIVWGGPWPEIRGNIIEDYRGGRGGHAVLIWLCKEAGLFYLVNSWGPDWNDDGMILVTEKAFGQMLRHPSAVAIGYGPEQMVTPDLEPIS